MRPPAPTTSTAAGAERDLSRLSILLVMLVFQLAAVFMRPVLLGDGVQARWLDLIFAALILAALWAVSRMTWGLLLAAGLAVTALGLGAAARLEAEVSPALLASHGLGATFFLFVAVVLLRAILVTRKVDRHVLAGAACVYLLFGMAFSLLFGLVAALQDGAFTGIEETGSLPHNSFAYLADFQYFSFVTLTTLGYGDITPATSVPRGLAVAEAVLGQLFLAMLVARLVGLQIATETARRIHAEEP